MAVWLSMSLSQGTPNETTRTTTVTATVTVHYNNGSHNGYSPAGTLTIDGQSFNFTCNFNYAGIGQGAASQGEGSTIACEETATVEYGDNSTRTVYASALFNSGTSSGQVSASDSITLTSISSGGGDSGGGDSGDSGDSGGDSGGSGDSGTGTNKGNCSVIEWAYYDTYYNEWKEGAVVGYGGQYSPYYYTYRLSFTTPDFTGISEQMQFVWENTFLVSESAYLRYAILSSDVNISEYTMTANEVVDENQVISGIWGTVAGMDSVKSLTVSTANLKRNTQYYLVIWTGVASTADQRIYLTGNADDMIESMTVNLVYEELSSVAYIDNASELESYQCYIEDGTSWDEYEAYVDDGTSWQPLS